MKPKLQTGSLIVFTLLFVFQLQAQDKCKVASQSLSETYKGECKNGLAHGKGEAQGTHRYVGMFRHGFPNGKGMYYADGGVFYEGNFQEGLKEGKGEAHYPLSGRPDSIVKGFWSADVYRGKTYKTYDVSEMPAFERVDITPSDGTGNTFTIEITSTSGTPRDQYTGTGYSLSVIDVVAKDGSMIRKLETADNPAKYLVSYEITSFPVKLQGRFSNGRSFNIELYKKATWRMQIFVNR